MTNAYTNPLSITSQFSFCGLPFRMDTYTGCAMQCSYCFARHRGGKTYGAHVRPANPDKISGVFSRSIHREDSSPPGVIKQFIRRRVPIHFGGMSDPFQPVDRKYRVTEKVLSMLGEFQYPTVLSTKSAMAGEQPYFDLLRANPYTVVQFSFSTTRDALAQKLEPGASPPSALLAAMTRLARAGVHVTVRWQPYIPGVSEPPAEFVSRVASAGVKHMAIEHLKVPLERVSALWTKLCAVAEKDLYAEYKALGAWQDGRELVLPPAVKKERVYEVADLVRAQSMTFGAADYEFLHLSDRDCCCSGVDQFPGFENWFKFQLAYAVRRSAGADITFESIENEWQPEGSIDRFLNSQSRLSRRGSLSGTVKDHLLERWEALKSPFNPTKFWGVSATERRSSSGRRIYEWNPPNQDDHPYEAACCR